MASPAQPNILYFLPDQHRHDWLGANPSLPLRTPHIDALCRRGVRFTNAYCNSPLCAPSRASIASARGYETCGVINNGQPFPLELPTYYRSLRDAGYEVAGVGKFDLDKPTLDWNLDGSRLIHEWGFTRGIDNEGKLDGTNAYRTQGRPMGPYLAFLEQRGIAAPYSREHLAENTRPTMGAYTTCVPDDAYCDNWLSENGLRMLEDFDADRPWHLVINFTGPHDPMEITSLMRERWENVEFPQPVDNRQADREGLQRVRQNYAAMIENIDRQVGRFVDLVRRRGELDRTLIIYASDHGEMLSDHERRGKSTWYEPAVGVPLIVSGPGIREGAETDALVSMHDVTATMLDFCGQDALPGSDARSLRPVLEGGRADHRDFVISGLGDWRMVFDGRWKLVTGAKESPILFDRAADPDECKNVAAQLPGEVARLGGLLE